METVQEKTEPQAEHISPDHPWLEIPNTDIDEEILYSLDEIRFA